MKKIIFFTASYPYNNGGEDSLIEPELKFLKKYFKITIVPFIKKKRIKKKNKLLRGIKINEEYAEIFDRNKLLKAIYNFRFIFNLKFWTEIKKCKNSILNFGIFKNIFFNFIRRNELLDWLKKNGESYIDDQTILYSFWFDAHTLALLDYKKINPLIKVFTRAHGSDLYENNNSIAFRKEAIQKIDKVLLISRHGIKYLINQYPLYKKKFVFAPLGIEDRNIINKNSKDNVLRVITCSFIKPVKRLDFVAHTLKELSKVSQKKIEWFHIGSGKNFQIFRKKILKILPQKKVSFFFLGRMTNKEIFNFYKTQNLDLFLLLSLSEGRPVSIMEAMSVGLPIFATNVGGIPELVGNNINGNLVETNTSSINVALQLNKLIANTKLLKIMRRRSRSKWKKIANSNINNKILIKNLIQKT